MNADSLSSLTLEQKSWLTDPRSLSKRLREHTQNHITFHLFYDSWGMVDNALRALLAIKQDEKTWIRNIEFRYDDVLWISAVVVIPESSITSDTSELSHVGKQAIGDLLFQDPTLTRGEFSFCEIAQMHFERHSIFHYKQKPLLIVETFFPAFFKRIS